MALVPGFPLRFVSLRCGRSDDRLEEETAIVCLLVEMPPEMRVSLDQEAPVDS